MGPAIWHITAKRVVPDLSFFPAYPFGLAYAELPAVLQVEAELLAQQEAQAHDHRVLRRYMTLTLGAISLGACAFGALPMFTSCA
jgi:hypothetical protein